MRIAMLEGFKQRGGLENATHPDEFRDNNTVYIGASHRVVSLQQRAENPGQAH
jgi:hypothetical protein